VKFEPEGSGYVTYTPPSENGVFKSGTTVTVTAHPSTPGKYEFSGWKNLPPDADSTGSVVTIKDIDKKKTLTATFERRYALILNCDTIKGGVTGKVNFPDTSWYPVDAGVSLRATAKSGYVFIGWEGNDTIINRNPYPYKITDRDVTFTVKFQKMPQVLIDSTGSGSVTINPPKSYYAIGDTVTLTPIAGADYLFTGWFDSKGGFLNDDNPYIVTYTTTGWFDIKGTFLGSEDSTDLLLKAEFSEF